ncbi:hypothetical protein Aple_055870 [Acrocarpospora pleiomorpha]|uniref:Uncharacterized protein n=1 Tax=Acrocarpospora pleiomorpha TaxID=90975 RepID=A0A5M3XRT8_9ACTN|nr:hypothetical protein [Acrocarpospora pleiomorpha]GES22689.1 hypothetical protein Aple_055870 [Acrocarpospora pleiomorpha]
MSHSADHMVPNPRHQLMERTLAELRTRVADLEAALDSPHRQFAGRPVWVGPVARRFAEDLSARRARLRQVAHALIADLESELRALPTTVRSTKIPPSSGGW